jgi:hypothetical protein
MIEFIKPVVITILIIGFWLALTAFLASLIAIPIIDLIGWKDYSGTFGRFAEYSLTDWFQFVKFTLIFVGGYGFLFGAFIGHPIGWGLALRKVSSPFTKMLMGVFGAITASFWFFALLYLAMPGDGRTFFHDFLVNPTLQLVASVPFISALVLIWMSHRKNWWDSNSV